MCMYLHDNLEVDYQLEREKNKILIDCNCKNKKHYQTKK